MKPKGLTKTNYRCLGNLLLTDHLFKKNIELQIQVIKTNVS